MLRATVVIGLFVASTAVQADSMLFGDAAKGKAFYDKHCVACHDTSVHTRKDRKVGSIGGLKGQVAMCSNQLKMDLPKDTQDDLVKYLNDAFYKYE